MKVTINGQERVVPIVTEEELAKTDNWRKFTGKFIDRNEIEVTIKGEEKKYWKYSDEEGKTMETWSPVIDHILNADHIAGAEHELYYEIKDDNYTKGKKLSITSVKTEEGWTTSGSKKQGRGDYSKQAALAAAASIYMGSYSDVKPEDVIKTADKFLVWLKEV